MADEKATSPEEAPTEQTNETENPVEAEPSEKTPGEAEKDKETETEKEDTSKDAAEDEAVKDRTVSHEETVQDSETAETKPIDEAARKKSKQSSSVKISRPSLPKDEVQKKSSKSTTSLREKRLDSVAAREDTRKSKARIALGSIIDIRRSSVAGEIFDRKAPRYMNTYKLESENPFNPTKVDKILESVMMEAMENLTYDPEKCPKQAKWASMAIRAKVKSLDFDRYKIISIVTIGEKHSQDVLVTCRFLWDADKDRYSTFSMENTYVFGIAQCFGLYYE